MHDNKIDSILRNQIEQLKSSDLHYSWDKNSSWERLSRKRKRKSLIRYYYIAAIAIIGFLLGTLFQIDYPNNNTSFSENAYIEYQNRQKLEEIEKRMSGNYYSVKICFACDDIYYEVIKQDRPERFTYYETILN